VEADSSHPTTVKAKTQVIAHMPWEKRCGTLIEGLPGLQRVTFPN